MKKRFCLHFGTGGIRELMGEGPGRLNEETVAIITQGVASWLLRHQRQPRVVIARDSRHNGDRFVEVTIRVLASHGIKVADLGISPTPVLSFAVRELGCSAGIVITASHNAKEYNGYKVYGPDGGQITVDDARAIQDAIDLYCASDDTPAETIDGMAAERVSVSDQYAAAVLSQSVLSKEDRAKGSELRIAYTPLNGTGGSYVPKILGADGMTSLSMPQVQAKPDGDFATCTYPNPENDSALDVVREHADSVAADLVLSTDPDADRTGVVVNHRGEWVTLTGNQVGVLLLDWICRMRKERGELSTNGVAVTTVVSSAMLDAVASKWGVELRRTLTGFKFIGEQIGLLEESGEAERFLVGIEESLGYLTGTYVRDKDGILGCMLVAEMVLWHRLRNRDLVEALRELCGEVGWHLDRQVSVVYKDDWAQTRMSETMTRLRKVPPATLAGLNVVEVVDYAGGVPMPGDPTQTLPHSNVLEYRLEGGSKLMVRPSGTEPKIKTYCFAVADNEVEATRLLAELVDAARGLLQ